MCLAVYLGIDRSLAGFSDPAVGEVGLEPDPEPRPRALVAKRRVYHVSDRVPTGWNCSCIFLDTVLPWQVDGGDDPADPASVPRARAYAGLARIARAALKADRAALIFSCWWGDQDKPPALTRQLAPGDIRPARYLFDDQLDGGRGGNPPILIRLTEEASR